MVSWYPPVPAVAASAMRRWSVSTEWVAEPSRTIEKRVTGLSVLTVTFAPLAAAAGAAVIFGRTAREPSALSRYGGVKISPLKWLVAQEPHSPPPPVNTRASGMSRATLWYVRAVAAAASVLNVPVAGSQSSGAYKAVLSENGTA